MTVYKYFIKVAMKHKSIILGYLGIFLILSIINGATTNTRDVEFTDTRLDISIVDRSRTEVSKGLRSYLSSRNNIVDTVDDLEYIKEQISIQMIDGAIIIPEDFEERLINKEESVELYKNNLELGALYLNQQIDKYLIFANGSYENGSFNIEQVNEALNKGINIELASDGENYGNKGANTWFAVYFNFTSYIIIAIYVAVIGLVMVEFKEKNIENRMKISSKKLMSLNKEIYLGQVTIGLLVTLFFILGSIILKGRHLGEVDFGKHVLNLFVFSFTILCFTFLINNLTSNRYVINGISTVFSLGSSFISGVMVPQEYLSESVLSIAKLFPNYYFVRINDRNFNSFMDLKYEIFMQLIFGIAFLLLGLYFSKVNQKS